MTELDARAAELRREFDVSGFLSLPGFLSRPEVAEVHREKQRFLERTVPALPAELVYHEDRSDPGTLKQVQRLFEHDSCFERMMFGSRFEHLARILLGEEVIGKNMQYFNKPAGVGRPTPPHQDGYYFMLEPNHAVTLWLALEDVTVEQGCVHYVRGSHALGMREHAASDVIGFSQHIPDFGTDQERDRVVACPCKAGDLIAHHSLTIHWAGGNVTRNRSREALGFIYYARSAREDRQAQARYQRRLAARLAEQGRI